MEILNKEDYELLKEAQNIILLNYDTTNFNHTVGAAVRCSSGKIYVGVNVYSLHGACAEQVALGNAITNGERNMISMVAVRGEHGEEILPPCGNCRQILMDYAPECQIILSQEGKGSKVTIKDLLPFAYMVNQD